MAGPWNENLKRLLPIIPTGSGDEDLAQAMKKFHAAWQPMPLFDPAAPLPIDPALAAAVDAAVVDIATALNWDVNEARQAYEIFKHKARAESKEKIKSKFIGSKVHMLFGHVVGEVLELPPVFGALLSPTGGMVGPGPFAVHVPTGTLAYHGVSHDAGGYLCRCHKEDPGYEYIEEQTSTVCEDDPFEGQASGIYFWFKLFNFGWLNFLAVSDPTTLMGTAPAPDISSLFEPGPLSAADPVPSSDDDEDGVVLDTAEIHFLQMIISGDGDSADEDLIEKGRASLELRGLLSGSVEEGYTFSDQLIMAMAISMEPELIIEAAPAGLAAGEQPLRTYGRGDLFVEQTTPSPGKMRLACLRDDAHMQERLLKLMPFVESDLGDLSLSLTEDEFDSAVAAAAAGEIDPDSNLGLDSADALAVTDLSTALDSGQLMGTIRVQQFDGGTITKSRDLSFIQGGRATWLVSREAEQSGRVNISLASPAAIGQELKLT